MRFVIKKAGKVSYVTLASWGDWRSKKYDRVLDAMDECEKLNKDCTNLDVIEAMNQTSQLELFE